MLVLALACVTTSDGKGSANEANGALSVMSDSTIAAANEEIESLLSEGRSGEAVAAGLELLSRIEAHGATMTFQASHEAAETPDLVAKAMLEFTPSAKDDAELARRGIAVKERLLRRYEAYFLESLVNYGCFLDNEEANAAARLVFERVLVLADTLHLEADQRARILERLARVLESEGHVDSALATWDLVSRAEKSNATRGVRTDFAR